MVQVRHRPPQLLRVRAAVRQCLLGVALRHPIVRVQTRRIGRGVSEMMRIQRDDARRREASSADGARSEQPRLAREDDVRRRREREEEERRRIAEQRRFGQSNGQNQSVTMPQPAVAPPVQYPPISGPVTSAPASTDPIANHLQMPLESPTRYVIHQLKHTSPACFDTLATDLMQTNLTDHPYTNPSPLLPLSQRTRALFSILR
ncbi:hypothetical protein EDB86DRAFT_534076 [Lactarius hatsudake]|nr:hypothetical protein EDB86DRAFT_534076 [Lactarius hatsudake]